MDERQLRQVLARNLERFMGEETQAQVAKKAGIAQSHVSRLLRCEASATTDLIAALSKALGVEPWEFLMSEEATREAIYKKVILGTLDAPQQEGRRPKKALGDGHDAAH